jgi:hypothetical protein
VAAGQNIRPIETIQNLIITMPPKTMEVHLVTFQVFSQDIASQNLSHEVTFEEPEPEPELRVVLFIHKSL